MRDRIYTADDCWWLPLACRAGADVVHVNLSAGSDHRAAAWLDRREQGRLKDLRHPGRRHEFILCRAALRASLCDRLDCANGDLVFDALHGKPFARVRGIRVSLHFNVSHSGDHGLIAFHKSGRIGVDVEMLDDSRDLEGAGKMVFTSAEQRELASVRGQRKTVLFYSLWTKKEALIKAQGKGFGIDPCEIEIPRSVWQEGETCEFSLPGHPATRWRLEDIGSRSFAAAMAYELADSRSA